MFHRCCCEMEKFSRVRMSNIMVGDSVARAVLVMFVFRQQQTSRAVLRHQSRSLGQEQLRRCGDPLWHARHGVYAGGVHQGRLPLAEPRTAGGPTTLNSCSGLRCGPEEAVDWY